MAHGLKKRRTGFREPRNWQYAIFLKGTVTEPAYFNGMKGVIEKTAAYKGMIYVEGTGSETQSGVRSGESLGEGQETQTLPSVVFV